MSAFFEVPQFGRDPNRSHQNSAPDQSRYRAGALSIAHRMYHLLHRR